MIDSIERDFKTVERFLVERGRGILAFSRIRADLEEAQQDAATLRGIAEIVEADGERIASLERELRAAKEAQRFAEDADDERDRALDQAEQDRDRWRGLAHHLVEEACFSDDGECPHYKAALADQEQEDA